jgi:FtsP/CotA-like multicopper oxidase with cupredoxin domain
MTESRLRPSRRALILTGIGLFAAASTPATASGKAATIKKRTTRSSEAARARPASTDRPLPIPRVVDLVPGTTVDLAAETATHAFLKDRPVPVIGYGGTYMGPVLRVGRGTTVDVHLINRLDRPTAVHWHGLVVDGATDVGPLVPAGAEATVTLAVDQPAATLWYHAHVPGRIGEDVHAGLAGLLLVEDRQDPGATSALPSEWGVDDLPLILQDREFDADGRPLYDPHQALADSGFRGTRMIVNGIVDPVARVPQRLVRLRLVNAANARTFRLFFEDERSFHLIAGDGGRLAAPVELTYLALGPGERAEIVVDFADGGTALMTGPDDREQRAGDRVTPLPDVLTRPAPLVAFQTVRDEKPNHPLPAVLAALPALPKTTMGLKRRRFELRTAAPTAAPLIAAAPTTARIDGLAVTPTTTVTPHPTINGRIHDAGRIDETVGLDAVEVWEVVSPDMPHAVHLHGARFRVLSEDGERPKAWNGGFKDTVLVENSAELLVSFTRPADAAHPFLFHAAQLELEDAGLAAAFTVG